MHPMHLSPAAGLLLAGSLLAVTPTAASTALEFPGIQRPASHFPIAAQEREHVSRDEAAGAAIEAIRANDFDRAREILGQELVVERLDKGRADLDAGNPAAALPAIDRALQIDPRHRGALRLRAEGLMMLGEDRMNAGGSFVLGTFEDAERAFERSGPDAFAWFGRARAAYLQNRASDAHDFAQRGARLLRDQATVEASAPTDENAQAASEGRDPSDPPIPLLEQYRFGSAQRILADSCYLAYAEAAQAAYDQTPDADAAVEAALYLEALGEIDALVATAPDRADTWLLLSNLHLYRSQATGNWQDTQRALDATRAGLDRLPDDPSLLGRLTSTARTLGGNARAAEVLGSYVASNPAGFQGVMALSQVHFENGLELVPTDLTDAEGFGLAREQFNLAEARFVEAESLATGEAAGSVASWKAISITASGWMAYWGEDLESARAEFLRSEDVMQGGAQVTYGDRMRSGVRGLQGLVGKHNERGDLGLARDVQDDLVRLLPDDSTMWNDAGFFRREVANALQFRARELCRAAGGEETDPERLTQLRSVAEVANELYGTEAEKRMFREHSETLSEAARTEMERSAQAYEQAILLAPDDVVVLNDSALIYVHYLHRDLELAEQRFLRAIELGGEILAEEDLDDETRNLVSVPYGDAHENLGVLYLEHSEQPERARAFFKRALEFGPGPRPKITEFYLPVCDGKTPTSFVLDVHSWGKPCS